MSSGGNYVAKPYSTVSAKAARNEPAIPSTGAVIVGGVYYAWENSETRKGFTGNGSWFTNIQEGPTYAYFSQNMGSASTLEAAAQNYVDTNGNLDAIFEYWRDSPDYDVDQYQAFLNAIQSGARGCASV